MKTLSSLFLSLTCVLGMSSTVSATPIKGPVSIEALEVFETSPEDYTFVCARYQGESTTLVPGKIKGIDFYPVTKISIKRLQRKAKKARNEKLEQWFLRRAKKAQRKIKRCKQERRISPLVVEQYDCGHDLMLTSLCTSSEDCGGARLSTPAGSASSIAAAYTESQKLCEDYLSTLSTLIHFVNSRLYGGSLTLYEGDGCKLFGCGIVPKGFAWNVYQYSAIGTVEYCKDGICSEVEVSTSARERSWDEAREVSLMECQKKSADLAFNKEFFEGYTVSYIKVPCLPGLFSNFISEK
jgi:hypothetical protein